MVAASLTELVNRAVDGDQTAWDAIIERFNDLLWAVARSHRLSMADAGDVVQATWLRLVEHLGTIREPERLAGWLSVTARHECWALLRRSGREVLVWDGTESYDTVDDRLPPVDLSLLQDERDAHLWRAFGQLPERCQALLRVLMAAEPMSYADVAQALDMHVGSIGPTRMRCLDRLRQLVTTSDYSFDLSTES